MGEAPCGVKLTTFLSDLQAQFSMDLRDNQGKRHPLWIVLLGVLLAILAGRDGNLSSIHRHIFKNYKSLCEFLKIDLCSPVSRSQLPIILSKVDVALFDKLIFKHFDICLSAQQKRWFSGDGKELRGSICKGDMRGEAVVQLLQQSTGVVVAQSYYSGIKESEILAIRSLLEESELKKQNITLDALHFNPQTLTLIEEAGGVYLVGLKNNQAELLNEMSFSARTSKPVFHQEKVSEKAHGRVDTREYFMFDVSKEPVDKRWSQAALKTLILTKRWRNKDPKTQEPECSFHISNALPNTKTQAIEFFEAVRNHWAIEASNNFRDTTLKEDKFRTKKTMLPTASLLSELSLQTSSIPKKYLIKLL